MMNEYKKSLHGIMLVSLCFLGVSTNLHADKDEDLRKFAGLVGAGLAANGLVKIGSKPAKGLGFILLGTVVGVGGICSDLILKKIKERKSEQGSSEQGFVQQVVADMQQAAHTFSSGMAELGSNVYAKHQLSQGWDNFSSGNFMTGLEQMYDGAYHGIRASCRKMIE